MIFRVTLSVVAVLVMVGCGTESASTAQNVNLDRIELPEGFRIEVFVDGARGARSLALAPSGNLYIGTRRAGNVYVARDTSGDGRPDDLKTIASGLRMPNGVALRNGDLFVAEIDKIHRFENIEAQLAGVPESEIVYDDLPSDEWHGWKYIAFGPDDWLYVPVGAPCNTCDREAPYSSILRIRPDGSEMQSYALGVRNTVGFDWHPETGELWFTDNGRDMMGDDLPPDELNHAPVQGLHFGFPYIHGGDIRDPEFGGRANIDDYRKPAQNLGPHVAALGMEFYTGDMFPEEYRNQAFIAEHGSWNRSKKIGYRVTLIRFDDDGTVTSYEPFATGWLQGEENWGRPVDLEQMPDGSLLLSDDQAGVVYRIYYEQ